MMKNMREEKFPEKNGLRKEKMRKKKF